MATRPVLLVDGDEDARIILRRLLEHEGYPVIEATDLETALSAARESDVAVIVTELYVSCGQGMACLVETVKRDSALASIPVIVVTTQTFGADEERARAAGSAGFIPKPFAAREVVAEIALLHDSPPP
jgi:two-component system alkaline phosphatase synthesis response regulator PhoP